MRRITSKIITIVASGGLVLFSLPVFGQSNQSFTSSLRHTSTISSTQNADKQSGQREFQAEVIQVVDGDTIRVRRNGNHQIETIKLIGVEAPEVSNREHEGQEPFGTMSQQYLSLAITRKLVRIEQDVQLTSETGELLGYIWVGDKLINEEIVKKGLAVLNTAPPNVKYVERFQQAQTVARNDKLGIWDAATPLAQSPSEFRSTKREAQIKQSELESPLELPEFVNGCIIGNRKTRKYHLPDGRFYKQAKESKNRAFFRSSEDAEKAGYVRSAK